MSSTERMIIAIHRMCICMFSVVQVAFTRHLCCRVQWIEASDKGVVVP